jgi:hypothetical protein
MFDLPNPVGMYEQAKNAGLEREIVEDILGQMYSDYITTRWTMKNIPILGPGLSAGAYATYVSLKNGKLYTEGKLRLTVPQDMLNPDILAKFQTEWEGKK